MKRQSVTVGLVFIALFLGLQSRLRATDAPSLKRALDEAGTNRTEMVRALSAVAEGEREGMEFLIQNMPVRDLQSLSANYLLENVSLAYEAFRKAPWRERLPKEIFLNEVLPYASVDESRDAWRRRLYAMAAPLVTDCQSPSAAAQRLNQKIFAITGVHYSTQRHSANQGPSETLESKIATCTGLSILLVDACRAVGVPARVAGTPLWSNGRGNHTWVEIWDAGWHFAGAAEPDPAGLDRGWFAHDASEAVKSDPEHAIYATSFAKTDVPFPMVWARNVQYVSAENVTDRYTPQKPTGATNGVRLLVKVLDRPAGQRVAARVTVLRTNNPAANMGGMSRDESADLNDILPFELTSESDYQVRVEGSGREVVKAFHSRTNSQEMLVVTLNDTPLVLFPSQMCYAPPPITAVLKAKDDARLKKALAEYFVAPAAKQANWKFAGGLEKLLRENEPAVRQAAWQAYREAPGHDGASHDFANNEVRFLNYRSPYTVKEVGSRPTNGWALFIAMHGGGGAPKEVNDSQWKQMQRYYRDHPEAGGYLYVALRAPNDTWNGFYDVYVYPLVANLIQQFVLLGQVNPNKVFIMGYSHGGYGAYAIGPKMPDRFAAIHASAAAATDGETTAKTLRNTRFTVMVGEKDTMYGRYERNLKFRREIEELRGDRKDIYPGAIQVIDGNGHTGLPDRDKIAEMYPAVRNPVPVELTWLMTDNVIHDFFWIRCDAAEKGLEIDASCRQNKLTVTTSGQPPGVSVFLDSRLIDFDKPVTIELNGRALKTRKVRPSLRVLCETVARRGDPDLAFTARVDL